MIIDRSWFNLCCKLGRDLKRTNIVSILTQQICRENSNENGKVLYKIEKTHLLEKTMDNQNPNIIMYHLLQNDFSVTTMNGELKPAAGYKCTCYSNNIKMLKIFSSP